METVELAIPAAVAVANLMGSDVAAGARAGVTDAQGCDTARGLLFAGPKIDKCSTSISQRDSECNANGIESASWIKKVETGSCRNTIQLSAMDSMALAAGTEGKRSQKKERRVPRISTGFFKIPQTLQLETSISPSEDVDMKDVADEHGSYMIKSTYAEKSQPLKQKNNLNSRRGDRRNAKVLLNAKHDGLAGFRSALGGSKMFGAYGPKADLPDITKLIDDISLNALLDGSYKHPVVAKEKAKRPANASENILHIVRKAFSVVQPQRLSQANKQYDAMDVSFTKEPSSLQNSNLSMASNLDVDEETSVASDLSCTKVQVSCTNSEDLPKTGELPLHHPRDVIEKLTISPSKDLNFLLQDATKPATISRCNEPRPGKPLSHRAALSTFSWSHSHYGHSKTNSESAKVSCRSFCQGRWIRIGTSTSFLGGGSESSADLDSLIYDHNLVPSGSVKYILPKAEKTILKISGTLSTEQASSLICPTPSPSPDLRSPKERTAAQALYDIANSRPNETAHGIVKWPKQPSQKAMKARKSKSIQGPENLLTVKSEVTLDNTVKFMDNATPWKKPKLSSSEKRDHSAAINTPRPPQFWSAPRSSRSSPIRSSREPAHDANKHHTNGSIPKPLFMAPPRRISEKSNHNQQHKVRKVLQTDWNRGKGQL